MADQEYLDILKQVVNIWKQRRKEHKDLYLYLNEAYLAHLHLRHIDLSSAKLWEAFLHNIDFTGANFTDADLEHADRSHTHMCEVYLFGADLAKADLHQAALNYTNLTCANLLETRGVKSCVVYYLRAPQTFSTALTTSRDQVLPELIGARSFRAEGPTIWKMKNNPSN